MVMTLVSVSFNLVIFQVMKKRNLESVGPHTLTLEFIGFFGSDPAERHITSNRGHIKA
jgi:hypothetical protein